MKELPLIAFLRLHRRLAVTLTGIVVSAAVILPACGDGIEGTLTPPGSGDFSVVKTGVVSGQTVTYTIKVTNNGDAAASTSVTDVLSTSPAGSQLTGAGCTAVSATSLTCNTPSINAGASANLTLVLTVPPGLGGGIVNCATLMTDDVTSNNQSCTENVITLAPNSGTITIVKNADPNDAQDFAFTTSSSAIPGFSLDDDANATLSNQQVFTNVTAGTYTFTETQVPGWDLSTIVCTPSAGTTVSVPNATATIVLAAGDNVTCTFTNKVGTPTTGTITIIKDAVPNVAQDFAFTSSNAAIPSFSLDDDADATLPSQRVFAGIGVGTYVITETATPGWSLANIACTPTAGTTVNVGAGTATIVLAGGGNVSCTFTNTAVVPVVDAVSTTTSSSTSTSVTLTGTSFFAGSDVTLRNVTTSEVFTNRSVMSTTSTQIVFSHTFGITTASQSWTVEVTGPNGARSVAKAFPVLPSVPVITTMTHTPAAPATGTGVILTISGRDFVAAESRFTITVNPVNDPPSTITVDNSTLTSKSSTQLIGSLTPTVAGRYDVRVQNGPTGTLSNIMSFTAAAPEPTTGTIVVNATMTNAFGTSAYTGPVSFTLTGPQTLTGTAAPQTFSSALTGSYTLTYQSGGPAGGTLFNVTSSATQTVAGGSTTTFTLNFR